MCDTLSQHDDHLGKFFVKSDVKKHSYGPETILLLGLAVTLTFKLATQMLLETLCQYGDQLCKIIVKSDVK